MIKLFLVVGDEQAYFIIKVKKKEMLDVFLYREDGSLHQPEYILCFA
jgi:hypothetical protein